jgi:hypothetical protein
VVLNNPVPPPSTPSSYVKLILKPIEPRLILNGILTEIPDWMQVRAAEAAAAAAAVEVHTTYTIQ